jgi:DeoR/GlpR family transcriptional regulator of sugar metabolism
VLASQRRDAILSQVQAGGVRVSTLVELLGVSDMTIRRDIEYLAAKGLVHKVHGGALPTGAMTAAEPGFVVKSELEVTHKREIAVAAAALVRPGSSIGISAGTTTHALARELRRAAGLVVVTNSMLIAQVLQDSDAGHTVILTGGTRTPSDALVGPVAVASLGQLHVDVLFLGVHGMSPRAGLTTPNLEEAQTNRALIAASSKTVVVADHTKWGVIGLGSFAELSEVSTVVTDSELNAAATSDLRAAGCEVVIAPPLQSAVG